MNGGGIKRPEILAPAGWFDSLEAALENGADAVYFGVTGFNMRATARNFRPSEMAEAVRLCHSGKARAYLALNCIVYENEIKRVDRLLGEAADAGVDGVICWDMAVVEAALNRSIPVHLSTQASTANSRTVLHYFRQFGIRRFVLARELTLAHVKALRRSLRRGLGSRHREIELETFVHGAMCVAVSGRCFMSQFVHGKSANRGECLQPCRRRYLITDTDHDHQLAVEGSHVLSPKDLCTLPFIEQLLEADIDSLKIEGRNRKADYVAVVTGAYRKAVDFYCANRGRPGFDEEFLALKKELMERLDSVFHRGFSPGFYHGVPLSAWTDSNGNKSPLVREYVGRIVNFYRKIGVAEIFLESRGVKKGELLLVEGRTTGAARQEIGSLEVEHRQVEHAPKGIRVACRLDFRARPGDKVFILSERSG